MKKGKKQQKLQSCKVAFLQLFVFFQQILAQKNLDFFVVFFFELQKFGFQKPYPYFLGVWTQTVFMSETLSLFFFFFGGGVDLNSLYFRNSIFGGSGSQQFLFQKPYPYFFWVDGSQPFSFQKPSSYFFWRGLISTVFISETFVLFSEMKTVEIHTTQKK